LRPVVTIVASHAVRSDDATAACGFFQRRADGRNGARIDAALAPKPGADGAGDARSLALTPAEPLRRGADYAFRCRPAFRAARGGGGRAPRGGEPFSTHGAAAVKKVTPTGNDVAADDVRVSIEFATPVDPTKVRRHVMLVPQNRPGQPPQPLDLAADAR